MQFEFDPDKSAANKSKHGLDFSEAQALWSDPDRAEISARSAAEPRRAVIARHAGKLWTAIVTQRGNAVRIISVRRARTNEEALYER